MSREASASPGKYRTDIAPYQREPMEAVTDPSVQSVTLMFASQTGKTEIINNIVGYFISADPSPILVVQPTTELAESWSKERLTPMIRDTPALKPLVMDARSRDSGNTVLHKSFPGGNIAIVGANAPSGLAGRPRRVVLPDEVDRYPASAGTEGDPVALAVRRTESFWNAIVVMTSTPTIKGVSRIEKEFDGTDQRKWFCPCPHCSHWQTLEWRMVKWEKDGTRHKPETAWMECQQCAGRISDEQRVTMMRAGEWRPTAQFLGRRGYHINGLCSPFKCKRGFQNRLHQMVSEFLEADRGGVNTLKTWTNTFLAETWEDPAEKPPLAAELLERCENYLTKNDDGSVTIPDSVLCVTASADTQSDRVELEFKGWGFGDECWGLGRYLVAGNPELAETWDRVESLLQMKFMHPSGAALQAAAALFDRGGTNQKSPKHGKAVDDFTRPRNSRRVYSCYGSSTAGQPIISAIKPLQQGPRKVRCVRVGTDTAKGVLYSRLRLQRPGPRYLHFAEGFGYDLEYFEQLVSEREQLTWQEGKPLRKWIKTRARNEALDYNVYALAAIELLRPNYEALAKNLKTTAPPEKKEYVLKEESKESAATQLQQQTARVRHWPQRSTGFVGSWKR